MNKKIVTVIIVILALFSLIISFVLATKNKDSNVGVDEGNKSSYIIIDDVSNISYYNNAYHKTSAYDIENSNLNVYVDKNYLGKFDLKFGSKWNLYSNTKFVSYDGSLFAASNSLNLSLKKFKKRLVGNEEVNEINSILGYKINTKLVTNEVVDIDLDNNGTIDKIVNVSNVDYNNPVAADLFVLIYVVMNNNAYILINNKVYERDVLSSPLYSINNIWNINNSKYLTIDFLQRHFSLVSESVNVIFDYDNNEYRIVFEG